MGHSSVTYANEGGWVSDFPGKKLFEGVRFNVSSVTRWWVKFPEKKCYLTLEWLLT